MSGCAMIPYVNMNNGSMLMHLYKYVLCIYMLQNYSIVLIMHMHVVIGCEGSCSVGKYLCLYVRMACVPKLFSAYHETYVLKPTYLTFFLENL